MTTDEARTLALTYRGKFSAPVHFERSWERFFDKTAPPNQTPQAAVVWLERDLGADQSRAAGRRAAVGLDDTPHVPIDAVELGAIASGDLHDFRNPLLPAERHEAICVRCQLGIQSRRLADERARALELRPFPGLGVVLGRLFDRRRQRCQDCGTFDDEPSPETCPRSFWHLPDIWLTLHPDCTLADMGTIGLAMRGFLRRQRPVDPMS